MKQNQADELTYDLIKKYYSYYLHDEQSFINTIQYVELDQNNYKTAYSSEYCNILTCTCMDFEALLRVYLKNSDERELNEQYFIKSIEDDENLKRSSEETVKVIKGNYDDLTPLHINENPKDHSKHFSKFWNSYNKVKHHKITGIQSANQITTLNALAALYVLECYILKKMADNEGKVDLFDVESKLFRLNVLKTNNTQANLVFGKILFF